LILFRQGINRLRGVGELVLRRLQQPLQLSDAIGELAAVNFADLIAEDPLDPVLRVSRSCLSDLISARARPGWSVRRLA
jgi:hypothetical protein